MTEWFRKVPGGLPFAEAPGGGYMMVIPGDGDVVRLPPDLGGRVLRVLGTFRDLCPTHGDEHAASVEHTALEDGYGVADCAGCCNVFRWYRLPAGGQWPDDSKKKPETNV